MQLSDSGYVATQVVASQDESKNGTGRMTFLPLSVSNEDDPLDVEIRLLVSKNLTKQD